MTAPTPLLDTPAVALAVMAAAPCAVVDARDRFVEVNAAFAAKLNRPAPHLVGIEIIQLLRGVAVDEARANGCFRLKDATRDCWVRLERTPIQSGRVVARLIDVTAEWQSLTTLVGSRSIRD